MAVCHRSKSRGRGLSLLPTGCRPDLFVTYSAAAAAVATCGAIQALCLFYMMSLALQLTL